jgi:2-oxoisovalerate ferredoxin oxidoreductase beta subunit
MDSVFYGRFDRHAHGEGLKGQSTHYCPGCGHGLIHKYIAESIDELGVQDRTVAISPVGCAVFMYYYLDVGNSQAAHGRAPAVALGHKVANPESVVLSYQGDGDLASIGLAEIMQATSMGLPMTFIFVNNAIYGMTGGQMAPTTLSGQRTTTTPTGRGRITGEPMRMAETVAQMDAPVYVERVALYDNKQRTRAKKAIKKALQLQVENKGLGFVEVLAECPTHLHVTPLEAEQWVKEKMVPVFPLGVKKDLEVEPWFDLGTPSFEPDVVARVIGGAAEPPQRFSNTFPSHIHQDDIAIKFAGAGGDGAQTIALDSSVIPKPPELDPSIQMVGVPCTQIARDLGKTMVKNVAALGALQAATELFPEQSFVATMRDALQKNCALLEINEAAFAEGINAYKEATSAV